jgi:hypothetical protein
MRRLQLAGHAWHWHCGRFAQAITSCEQMRIVEEFRLTFCRANLICRASASREPIRGQVIIEGREVIHEYLPANGSPIRGIILPLAKKIVKMLPR